MEETMLRRGRNMFSVMRNLFIQGNKNKKFYNKLSIQVNLLVQFHHSSQKFISCDYGFIGKNITFANLVKLWHKTSTNINKIINKILNYKPVYKQVPCPRLNAKKKRWLFVNTKLINNLTKCVTSKRNLPH